MDSTPGMDFTTIVALDEAAVRWACYKHQMRLGLALMRMRIRSEHGHHRNMLISPHWLISSLASLIPGTQADARVKLGQVLYNKDTTTKSQTDGHAARKWTESKLLLRLCKHSLRIENFHYRDISNPIKPSHLKKFTKLYQIKGKELPLTSDEKPCLNSMNVINQDFNDWDDGPMLSTADYISLTDCNADTLLLSSVQFKGVWSKSFQLKYDQFHKNNGETIKAEMLFNEKTYHYYEDKDSFVQAIRINYKHNTSLSMFLILPPANLPIEDFVTDVLDYETLKRILKGLTTTKYKVKLTMPKFKLTSHTQMDHPIQQLENELSHDYCQPKDRKQSITDTNIDGKVKLMQRVSLEIGEQGEKNAESHSNVSLFGNRKEAQFCADRPFVYGIVANEVQHLWFLGVCFDPNASN